MFLTSTTTFGTLLRQLRKRAGMTQSDLAAAVGYSVSFIASLEQGRRLPDVKAVMQDFIAALGLQEETHFASHLVELAALARGERLPAAVALQHEGWVVVTEPFNAPSPRLPAPPTELLGREQVVKMLSSRLQGHYGRLLTLVGPPGIGKTRLALEVAAHLQHVYPDGACFVPLAAISDPALIPATIVTALGLGGVRQQTPRVKLLAFLRRKELLLLLDNFEPTALTLNPSFRRRGSSKEAQEVVAELLAECPGVRILVTSRERLHLRAEQRFPVPPLAIIPAVSLFIQCAQAVDPDFVLTPVNQPVITEICRRLDCLPLAIELSAARIALFSPSALLDWVQDHRLDLLTDGPRDLPARHRTLRNALHRSYELLEPEERVLFDTLGIFVGGFDLTAVAHFGFGEATLQALINKSLVHVEAWPVHAGGRKIPGERRFCLLETIREYALERLMARGEETQIRDYHCHYYAEYLRRRELDLKSKREKEVLVEIEAEIDNIRAGWRWAVACGHHTAIELCVDSLLTFYIVRGWYQEGADAFGKAVETLHTTASQTETVLLGKVLSAQGCMLGLAHHYKTAKTYLEESLAMLHHLGARHAMAYPLQELGNLAVFRGLFAESKPLFEESLAIYTEYNDRYGIMKGLSQLGWAMLKLGEIEVATAVLQQSLTLFRTQGPPSGMVWVVKDLGDIALDQGKYTEALAYYQESLTVSKETEYSLARAYSLGALGWVYMDLDDYSQAKQHYQEGLALFRLLGVQSHVKWVLSMLSYAAILNGELAEVKTYLDEIVSIARNTDGKEGWWYFCVQGELALIQDTSDEAEAYFQRSIALFEDIDDTGTLGGGLAWPLNGLGRAAYLRKDYQTCRQKFQEALLMAQQMPSVPEALDILTGMATLLVAVGEPVRAIELVGHIQHHPASRKRTKARTESLVAEIAMKLSPSVIAAALKKGRDQGADEI